VQVQLAAEDKTGTGIGNVKNRLQLLYPGSHVLQIHNNETNFVADLKLNLQ
jgi:two-component system, LytTR family, sensor kinase